MKKQSKVNIYNDLVTKLSNEEGVVNFTIEKKEDFDFSFVYFNKLKVIFNLRSGADILVIKSELTSKSLNSDELANMGNVLFDDSSLSKTSYEDKLIVQKVVPLLNLSDADAENKIRQDFFGFIEYLRDRITKLTEFDDIIVETTPSDNTNNKEKKDNEANKQDAGNENSIKNMETEKHSEVKEELKTESSVQNETVSKDISKANSNIAYERAPEVVVQMQDMYKEMSALFDERKALMDEREEALNKKENELVVREQKLKEQQGNIDEEQKKRMDTVLMKEAELELRWKEYELKESTLDEKIKQYENKSKKD